ncbi:MAG: L-fuconolactonase [Chloroflexota bacterium]|jgi:predicted TIM-barrel fold metal-dependent hydrolase|nr:L-fuconolactonase [Chloroflexota bacterium]
MTVVDTHLHVWNAETDRTPWRRGWAKFADGPSYDPLSAIADMDAAGVDRALLLPAAWDVRGNELVLDAATAHPARFRAVLAVNPAQPTDAVDLGQQVAQPEVAALRAFVPPGVAASWLDGDAADWLWSLSESTDTPVMVWAPGRLRQLQRVIGAHPQLRLVIDHLNLGMGPSPVTTDEVTDLCSLANHAAVAVKASALPAVSNDGYPFADMRPVMREVVDAFGAERVFWGSDKMRLPCTYRESLTTFTEGDFMSRKEMELVTGGAVSNWLTAPRVSV